MDIQLKLNCPKCRKFGLKWTLSDSIYNGSHFLFDVLKFKKDWLKEPVSTWKNISSYQVFEKFVKTLNVCNDSAERAIKLISDYSNSLTIDNEEREKIMQLVQANRKKIKDTTKETLFK